MISLLFYIFLFSFLKNNVLAECEMNSTVEETLKLLRDGDREIRFSEETKNFTFVMGKTGIGKTPFTKFLTVNNSELISEQASPFDPFLMKDTDGSIGKSLTQSATLFPDLYMLNGTAYYDFPGFRDTRCLFYSLATIYSIKRVVDYAEGAKLLLLIDYDSVKRGGARDGFQNLLDDIGGFIVDISKFKDSIALVVTKIPLYVNSVQPTDTEFIDTIGQTLLQIKNELTESKNTTTVKSLENAVFIIDTLTANNCSRIGLFRSPDRAGPFSEIPIFREGKTRIEDIISRELTFTNSTGKDFHIPVHNELKGDIQILLNEIIDKSFIPEITSILGDIRLFYAEQMQSVIDISTLNDTVSAGTATLTKITTFELIAFVNELLNAVDVLEISTVSKELLNNVTTHINHVTFLRDCDPKKLNVPAQFMINIQNTTELITTDFKKHIEMLTDKSLSSINGYVNDINKKLVEYHESYENETFDLNTLYDGMTRYYKNLTDIKFDGLTSFSWQISELFNMTLSVLEFNVFLDEYTDDTSFNELKLLSSTKTQFDRKEILKDFTCVKEFADSSMWYKFLKNFYSNLNSIDTEKLLTQCTNEMDTNKRANEITELLSLMQSINMDTELYENVKDITLNSRKMKALESVVKQTTNLDVTCSGDTLTASGHTVRISQVQKEQCWSTAANIEIFSFYKLHMDNDIDLEGREVKLSIIAPTWNIIGKRKINLDGVEGKALDAVSKNIDGDPGLPGGSGGGFFGIGDKIIGSQNLVISSCGGKGGAGQNGKTGRDGIAGVDPKYVSSIKWNDIPTVKGHYSAFKVEESTSSYTSSDDSGRNPPPLTTIYNYTIYGTASTPPTNGGDGGAGGIGGLAGDIRIVTINQAHQVEYKQLTGAVGANGTGASGGRGMEDGTILEVKTEAHTIFFISTFSNSDPVITHGTLHANGTDGVSGHNAKSQHDPIKVGSISLPFVVSNYKKHLREKLIDSVTVTNLRDFLNHLNENTEIAGMSDALSFITEFQDLESQYYSLHQNLPFKPFLETLLHQIKAYSEKDISADDKTALSILYPAIFSKIIAVNKPQGTIFDVSKYLSLINNAIVNYNDYSKQENINNYKQSYRDHMENKIKSAMHLIDEQLLPDIDTAITSIDKKIDSLLDELARKRNKTEDAIKETFKQEKKLKHAVLVRQILAPIKMVAGVLSVLGPEAAIVGGIFSGVVSIGESGFIDSDSDKPPALNSAFGKVFNKITDEYKNKQENFVEELNGLHDDINKIVTEDKKTLTEAEIRKNGECIKTVDKLNDFMKDRKWGVPSVVLEEQNRWKNELKDFTDDFIKFEKEKGERSNKKILKRLNKIQSLVILAEVSVDSINRIIADKAKLKVIASSMKTLNDGLITAQKIQENIYTKLLPRVELVHNTIQENKNLTGKSHAELGITKWQVQSTLRDTKTMIAKVTAGFNSESSVDLVRLSEKLDDGFATLIEIYDRLESYKDQIEFASYVGEIGSVTSDLVIKNNTKLSESLTSLKKIIQTNLVIERYNEIIHATKQHKFPFAEFYLEQFELPKSLATDEPDVRIQQIKGIVQKLDEIIAEAKIKHSNIHNYVSYDNFLHNSKRIDAFYKWQSGEFKNEITDFLSGKNITLLADINNVSEFDAVKFKRIGIYLKTANETVQKQLNQELLNFRVTMKMLGNNFLRCDNKIYSISINDEIIIDISFDKDTNGFPVATSDTVKMINNNDYFLSPYTWWVFQLEHRNGTFDNLEQFKNETIDLLLDGAAQYLKRDPSRPEICTERLSKYYTVTN